jgi:flagellar hook assembly protein FlgD
MIKVSLPPELSSQLKIEIFTVAGKKIRTIEQYAATGGAHYYMEWDGKNQSGEDVASGVYFGRLTVENGHEKFFKMAVIK